MLSAELKAKDLREGMIYYCGYCDIQEAAKYLPEIGYTCGVYGWNATVYAVGSYAIASGYRPAGWQRLTRYECERLNAAARNAEGIPGIHEAASLYGVTCQYLAILAEFARIREERRAAEG